MDAQLNLSVLLGCLVLLVAVLAVRVSRRTGLPVLLLYLALGLAVGSGGLGVDFQDYALTADLGLLALALILAEGGLTTRWAAVRPVLPFAGVLATLGVAISVGVVTGVTLLLLDVELRTAVILGSIVSSTDAAAVFSVLRKLQLRERVKSALEVESGLNDAPVVVLVLLASSEAWGEDSLASIAFEILSELALGVAVGVAVGWLGVQLLGRAALGTAGLYPIATVGLAVLAYSTANAVHGSGFLAVYLAGLVLGNSHLPHRRAVIGFASSVALLAEAGLFVLLGLLVSPDRLTGALLDALVVGAAATFLARPLAVAVSALTFRFSDQRWRWREQVFVSWAGLRGAVPIVVATVPVTQGVPGGARVLDVVFVLVVVYTLLQAPTLPFLGRWLGLVDTSTAYDLEVEAAPLEEMDADLLQLSVPPGSHLAGVYVTELRLPPGAHITLIVRDGSSLVPRGETRLLPGDQLLVVAADGVRDVAEARLRAVARGGKLARWYGA